MQDAHRVENRRTPNLLERLEKHPQLQTRIEAMLEVVENAAGDVSKADEAEQRLIEELRKIGQEAMQAWANRKHAKVQAEVDARSDLSRKEKKSSPGTAAWELSK
ncbi:MAG: hypothetical protein HY231_08125 [Acidobacteria bacterium]|nr:hypothetical protein [Acidobacteriota bacterium]